MRAAIARSDAALHGSIAERPRRVPMCDEMCDELNAGAARTR